MFTPEILLSSAYLPPVQYLAKFIQYPIVWLETQEHFIKQTYRNRTVILTANGPESLIIPIEKGRSQKQKIKDLHISYDTDWQHTHWQAIVSAYNSSPFFEILETDFRSFYKRKFEFLFDYNYQLLQVVFDILDIKPDIRFTEEFEEIPENCQNFREAIQPKQQKTKPDHLFNPFQYTQVFEDKFGFVPNLSILDVLFNCGSTSYEVLLKSFRKEA